MHIWRADVFDMCELEDGFLMSFSSRGHGDVRILLPLQYGTLRGLIDTHTRAPGHNDGAHTL